MPNIGPAELALLLFGAKRLPEIGRSIGQGMREFKDSLTAAQKEPGQLEAPAPANPKAMAK